MVNYYYYFIYLFIFFVDLVPRTKWIKRSSSRITLFGCTNRLGTVAKSPWQYCKSPHPTPQFFFSLNFREPRKCTLRHVRQIAKISATVISTRKNTLFYRLRQKKCCLPANCLFFFFLKRWHLLLASAESSQNRTIHSFENRKN